VSVVGPAGFRASGIAAGIKASGVPDMALVCTEDARPASAAAIFTSNRAVAAPVVVSRENLRQTGGLAVGVVLTSGNANAATGRPGVEAARTVCAEVAGSLAVAPEHLLICQTGLIGVPFPVHLVPEAASSLVEGLGCDQGAGERAAEAIMTTDTVRKEALVVADGFSVGGMAKGAAMLAPDMATMLAVLTTDAACDPGTLRDLLRQAGDRTFNAITVDGCTSTNDTVVVLASGQAGPAAPEELAAALETACATLARQMVEDAEGATLVARVYVGGALTDEEAHRAARQVADSLLVKCSLNGGDPYWGRIVSELGSAGVGFELDRVSVSYGGTEVCRLGVAVEHDEAAVASHLAGGHVEISCELGLGDGSGVVLSNDLGYGYLDENRTTS
jgi:glutamate N-acetyltransferase / amino-acid N-acetyltransferase